ncbi:type 1 glutamine amidotransferase, partial [Brachyspira hampsonii]|nr:type 1 glutamine amidotransferase [Brachyspira hampsonii]
MLCLKKFSFLILYFLFNIYKYNKKNYNIKKNIILYNA